MRFFALDSNYMDREQIAWLEKELAASGSDWKIAFFHHPLYSSGGRHGSEVDLRKQLEPLFLKYGVNVVFAGHEHFYERIKPQKGIYYFTAGGSAKLRAGDIQKTDLTAVGFDTDNTYMLVEVAGDAMHFQTLSRTGKRIDGGSITKVADAMHQRCTRTQIVSASARRFDYHARHCRGPRLDAAAVNHRDLTASVLPYAWRHAGASGRRPAAIAPRRSRPPQAPGHTAAGADDPIVLPALDRRRVARTRFCAALVRLPLAAALGTALALRPRRRGTPPRQPAVVQTQIVLAVVGALIMLVVGASLARAFGIVGAANLIRYRSKIDDPKDAVVMLCALSVGLAAGVGLYRCSRCSARCFWSLALWIIEGFEPQTRVFELSVKLGDKTAAAAPADRGASCGASRPSTSCAVSPKRKCRIVVTAPLELHTDRVSNALTALVADRQRRGRVERKAQDQESSKPRAEAHCEAHRSTRCRRRSRRAGDPQRAQDASTSASSASIVAEIEKALAAAVARGVRVRALIAHTNRGGEARLRKLEQRLLAAGVTVTRTADDLLRYHGKFMVADDVLHVFGFNFTKLDIDKSRSFGIATRDQADGAGGFKLFEADVDAADLSRRRARTWSSVRRRRATCSTAFIKGARKELAIYDAEDSGPGDDQDAQGAGRQGRARPRHRRSQGPGRRRRGAPAEADAAARARDHPRRHARVRRQSEPAQGRARKPPRSRTADQQPDRDAQADAGVRGRLGASRRRRTEKKEEKKRGEEDEEKEENERPTECRHDRRVSRYESRRAHDARHGFRADASCVGRA